VEGTFECGLTPGACAFVIPNVRGLGWIKSLKMLRIFRLLWLIKHLKHIRIASLLGRFSDDLYKVCRVPGMTSTRCAALKSYL
jgi:hypothetical protein